MIHMSLQSGPVICPKLQDGQSAIYKVLLMAKVLVGYDEHVEACFLRD